MRMDEKIMGIDFKVIDKNTVEFDGDKYYKVSELRSSIPSWLDYERLFSLSVILRVHLTNFYKVNALNRFGSANHTQESWGYWRYDSKLKIIEIMVDNDKDTHSGYKNNIKLSLIDDFLSNNMQFYDQITRNKVVKIVDIEKERIFNSYIVGVDQSVALPGWFRFSSILLRHEATNSNLPHAIRVNPFSTFDEVRVFSFFSKRVMERFKREIGIK